MNSHIILVQRPAIELSLILLDVPSCCIPVNFDKANCIWYKLVKDTVTDRGAYSHPSNAKLHVNGTIELLSTDRGYNVFLETAQKLNKALSLVRLNEITVFC